MQFLFKYSCLSRGDYIGEKIILAKLANFQKLYSKFNLFAICYNSIIIIRILNYNSTYNKKEKNNGNILIDKLNSIGVLKDLCKNK